MTILKKIGFTGMFVFWVLVSLFSPASAENHFVNFSLNSSFDLKSDFMDKPSAPDYVLQLSENKKKISTATIHKYFGYATVALAAATGLSSSDESLHEGFAYAATTSAIITCVSGYKEYGDNFILEEGFTATNIHIVAGTVATVGFIAATALGANGDSHGGIGGASAFLMAVPLIVFQW
jgi:hypothetical protein